MSKFDSSAQTYTAPISGYYNVSAQAVRYIPTGKFETVENEDRKWFQFWKPKTVTREILKREEIFSGQKTVFLNKGESVDTKDFRRIT